MTLNTEVPKKSRKDFVDHTTTEIGEAIITAVVAVSELFVIETEEVEQCGVEVVDVDFVFHGFVAEFVSGSMRNAAFDAATPSKTDGCRVFPLFLRRRFAIIHFASRYVHDGLCELVGVDGALLALWCLFGHA